MPCTVEHTPYWPPKKTQNYTAGRLLEWLETYLHEEPTEGPLDELGNRTDAVPKLCAKIKGLGGTDYIKQLVEDNPKNGMWSNHASQMSRELLEWWKEHQWRDKMRERAEKEQEKMNKRTKDLFQSE